MVDGHESRRKHPRYRVNWPAVIVKPENGKQVIVQGKTYDISLGGVCLYIDQNVFFEGELLVLLKPSVHVVNGKEIVIQVHARMINTILTSDHQHFRAGLQFLEFAGNGRDLLVADLSKRTALLTD